MVKKLLIASLIAVCASAINAEGNQIVMRHGNSFDKGWGGATVYTPYVSFNAEFTAPYVGAKITQVRFALNKDAGNVRLYINENVKDEDHLVSKRLYDLKAGWQTVTLDEPMEIVAGKNIAIGYKASFSSGDGVGICEEIFNEANYIYVNGEDRWETFTGSLCIEAIIEGENLPGNELKLTPLINKIAPYDAESFTFSSKVRNIGFNDVENFTIEYSIGDNAPEQKQIDVNIAPNGYADFSFDVPVGEPANYDVKCSIVKVNGAPDAYEGNNSSTTKLLVRNSMFKRYIACEEGTGLWCGWCPSGITALEKMKEKHGEQFCGISLHSGDVLEVPGEYPHNYYATINKMPGFPQCYVNRRQKTEAYFHVVDPVFESTQHTDSPMKYSIKAEWNEDSTAITVHNDILPRINAGSADYKFAYALVEDGITGYPQTNYFAQNGVAYEGWELRGNPTMDVVFNDLCRGIFPKCEGDYMLTNDLTALEETAFDFTFNLPVYPLKENGNKQDYDIRDKKNVRVIGLVINDKQDYIETCFGTTPVKKGSGVEAVKTGNMLSFVGGNIVGEITESGAAQLNIYDLSGRTISSWDLAQGVFSVPVNAPKGLYIVSLNGPQGRSVIKIKI